MTRQAGANPARCTFHLIEEPTGVSLGSLRRGEQTRTANMGEGSNGCDRLRRPDLNGSLAAAGVASDPQCPHVNYVILSGR